MKKILTTIFLLSALCSTALAGDWYDAASSNIDTIQAATGQPAIGFSRSNYKMAMNSSGVLYVLVWNDASSKSQVFTVNDWDGSASFTCNNDIFGAITQDAVHDHMTIYAFGDSAFALNADDGTASVEGPVIRKYAGATQGLLDTINGFTASVNGGVRGQVNVMSDGTKFLVLNSIEDADGDSLQIIEADGALTQTTAWTLRGQRAKMSGGLRIPFRYGARKGGFLLWDVDLSDLYWADTTGFATLTTTFLGDDMPAIGSVGELMCWMVPVVDSYFVVIWQKALTAAANCIVYARAGHINTAYSGITWDAAAVTLLDAGYIPGGFCAMPLVTKMPGTDSVLSTYLYWADTTNNDAMTIAYRISTDKGATWGAQADLVTPTEGWDMWHMQMPPTLARVGDSIRVALMFTDSVTTAAGGASARVWMGNFITTPPAVSGWKTLQRRNL